MKLTGTAVALCTAMTVLTACSSSSGGGGSEDAPIVDGGTFTMALPTDPGNLDPQASASSALNQVTQFAYDRLLSIDADTGEIKSGLAETWDVDGTQVSLTLKKGITCSDGSPFTASDAADNVNFVADPENESPFLGTYLPVGATATGDDAAGTVAITLESPAPFVLNGLASLAIVCGSGLDDRSTLADASNGTGPYELTEAAPGDHYDFTIRKDYTWGPDGADTATKGLPDKVVIKIVDNETTSANLVLSGEVNQATVRGPDATRLERANLFAVETQSLAGEQWYNHADGRVTSDPSVRLALTHALDLDQLRKVITSNRGTAATTLATVAPTACPGDSVTDALPEYDVAKANQLLDDAGWTKDADGKRSKDGEPFAIKFVHDTVLGTGGSAAAELATKQWTAIGAEVTTKGESGATISDTLFSTGDWDVSWEPLGVSSPDQLVSFLSGPVAPEGTNFSGIKNAEYEASVAKASALDGAEGCDEWLKAESSLISSADIVPFANTTTTLFGKDATFEVSGAVVPTSIRMRKN